MLRQIINVILFFTVLIIIVSCSENNDARGRLFDFYNKYLSPSISEIQRQDLIKKYCTRNMLETLDILYSFDEEEGLIIGIDYDPFLNAQDVPPIENLRIEKQSKTNYKVFLWGNNDVGITITLKKENNSWKIDSINSYNFERVKKEVESYWNKKGKDNPKIFSK